MLLQTLTLLEVSFSPLEPVLYPGTLVTRDLGILKGDKLWVLACVPHSLPAPGMRHHYSVTLTTGLGEVWCMEITWMRSPNIEWVRTRLTRYVQGR